MLVKTGRSGKRRRNEARVPPPPPRTNGDSPASLPIQRREAEARAAAFADMPEPPPLDEPLELVSTRLPTSLRRSLSELTTALRARRAARLPKSLPEQEVIALLVWLAGAVDDPETDHSAGNRFGCLPRPPLRSSRESPQSQLSGTPQPQSRMSISSAVGFFWLLDLLSGRRALTDDASLTRPRTRQSASLFASNQAGKHGDSVRHAPPYWSASCCRSS